MRRTVTDLLAQVARPRSATIKFLAIGFVVFIILTWTSFSVSHSSRLSLSRYSPFGSRKSPSSSETFGSGHPIDLLIAKAEEQYEDYMRRQTRDVQAGAKAYRERRGRHPPPGFEAWYNFAASNNAVIVEDFFDQIYDDIAPFWGLPAPQIREESKRFELTISIRNGTATTGSEWFWCKIWHDMISTIADQLPDMDIAVNGMDESRLVVPWETINEYMDSERKTRQMLPPAQMEQTYSGAADTDAKGDEERLNTEWDGQRTLTHSKHIRFSTNR
jgi:hypothetical protein